MPILAIFAVMDLFVIQTKFVVLPRCLVEVLVVMMANVCLDFSVVKNTGMRSRYVSAKSELVNPVPMIVMFARMDSYVITIRNAHPHLLLVEASATGFTNAKQDLHAVPYLVRVKVHALELQKAGNLAKIPAMSASKD